MTETDKRQDEQNRADLDADRHERGQRATGEPRHPNAQSVAAEFVKAVADLAAEDSRILKAHGETVPAYQTFRSRLRRILAIAAADNEWLRRRLLKEIDHLRNHP